MNIIGKIFGDIIFDFLWNAIRRIGALIRWLFLYKNLSIEEIFKQKWSGIIGILFLGTIITLALLIVH